MKLHKYSKVLKDNLKDRKFKEEFDKLDEEFTISREVLNLRKKKNMTQKELASLIGTSQPAIARLESGNYKNVSLPFIRKVANALGAKAEIHLIETGT
ncbi:MAG: helix-turn-helix domain-containing protein [Spirochaetia bacterium]|nr:helix-turn-helix domain-containing protein [Spirochaetia bacterium]